MILDNKTIVITGAGRGIGRSVAVACAAEGANLGLTARSIDELNETRDLALQKAPNAKIIVKTADVTKFDELEAAFKAFQDDLGLINGVIANAGIALKSASHECEPEQFLQVLDVNVAGVFNTFKAAYDKLAKDDKKRKARFMITGSGAYPNGMGKFAAYTASKWAVVGLQKALALEYSGEHIAFTTLLPNMVDTKLLRGRKAGDGNKPPTVMDPDELDPYYVFVMSDTSNKINDMTIDVNDFQQIRKLIAETPADKKASWDEFKPHLEEQLPFVYKNLKKLKALAEFLLTWP